MQFKIIEHFSQLLECVLKENRENQIIQRLMINLSLEWTQVLIGDEVSVSTGQVMHKIWRV